MVVRTYRPEGMLLPQAVPEAGLQALGARRAEEGALGLDNPHDAEFIREQVPASRTGCQWRGSGLRFLQGSAPGRRCSFHCSQRPAGPQLPGRLFPAASRTTAPRTISFLMGCFTGPPPPPGARPRVRFQPLARSQAGYRRPASDNGVPGNELVHRKSGHSPQRRR